MKKILKIVTLLLLICTLGIPAITKANWGGWYDGNTSNTWSGNTDFGRIPVNEIGRYEYRPENDSFYCFLYSSSTQKPQEFLIIEDSIFGKPVTELFYIEQSDELLYTVPSKGLYVPDSVINLDLFVFDTADFQNL